MAAQGGLVTYGNLVPAGMVTVREDGVSLFDRLALSHHKHEWAYARKCDVTFKDNFGNVNRIAEADLTVLCKLIIGSCKLHFLMITIRIKCVSYCTDAESVFFALGSSCSDRKCCHRAGESGWCVFAFFYMGLNHYIDSLLNYRLLFLSQRHHAIFEALLCSRVCGFALFFFRGRCACSEVYLSMAACSLKSIWLYLPFFLGALFILTLSITRTWKNSCDSAYFSYQCRGVVRFIVWMCATVISFCAGHYHNNTEITFHSLFVLPWKAEWALFFLSFSHTWTHIRTAVNLRCAHLNTLQFRFLQHSSTKTLSRHKQQRHYAPPLLYQVPSQEQWAELDLLLYLYNLITLFDHSAPWHVIACHMTDSLYICSSCCRLISEHSCIFVHKCLLDRVNSLNVCWTEYTGLPGSVVE